MHLPWDTSVKPEEFYAKIDKSLEGIVLAADYTSYWYFGKSLDQLVADGEGRLYVSLFYYETGDIIHVSGELNTVHVTSPSVTQSLMDDMNKVQEYIKSCVKDDSLLRMNLFNFYSDEVTPINELNINLEDLMSKKSNGCYSALIFRIK